MVLRLNTNELVSLSVVGEIDHPTLRSTGYVINSEGMAEVYPSVGGITYNVRIGDNATRWKADHVEPGVSISNKGKSMGDYSPNGALNVLSCIGNRVNVISGDAKGEQGYVTGKHGGIDHVMVDFSPVVLDRLNIGDQMLIKSFGVGLQLSNYFPNIRVMNIDPNLLQKLNIKDTETSDALKIGVTHLIPAKIMGSGLGSSSVYSGDYDIQIFDSSAIKKYGLTSLRLGDIVAIIDSDASYGWIYREGSVTIGVIVHSNSVISGHGPGVTTIMASRQGMLDPFVDPDANLINYLYGK